MALSIEAKLLALVDSDHADRVPTVLSDHLKADGNAVQWDFVDEFGLPLLLRLVETATTETMDLILKHAGPTVVQSVRDEASGTALHYAALNSNSEVALKLVAECPALVNCIDFEGCYPIHRAAKQGNVQVLAHLIPEAGINAKDTTGANWTALHYAASSRKVEACKALLAAGAIKETTDAHNRTASDIAAERSFIDVSAVLDS